MLANNIIGKSLMILRKHYLIITVCIFTMMFLRAEICSSEESLWMNFSQEFFVNHNVHKAKNILKKELKNNPNNVEAHSYLAILYYFQNKEEKAIREAEIVLNKEDDINMLIILYHIYSVKNDNDKKINTLNIMYNKFPDNINIQYIYLEEVLMPNKDYKEACNIINKLDDELIYKEMQKEVDDVYMSALFFKIPLEKTDTEIFKQASLNMIKNLRVYSTKANCEARIGVRAQD